MRRRAIAAALFWAAATPAAAGQAPEVPEAGGSPWSWLIGLGGLLAIGGGVLLRESTARSPRPPRPAPGPSGEGLVVTLRAAPRGGLEDPVEEGERVELAATVRNVGAESVPSVRLRIERDGDEQDPLLDRSWKRPLRPGGTLSASSKPKAARGDPLGPGLTTVSLRAAVESAGVLRAVSDEVTLHVGHPVLVVSLDSDPGGRVREGTEIGLTVAVGNVGRGTARDLEGALEVACEGRRGRDSWERTFEVEELKPGRAHEEGFRVSPSAVGERRAARLTARARVEASDEMTWSDEVTGSVTPA